MLLDHYQAKEGQDGFAKALIKRAVLLMCRAGKIEPEENVMATSLSEIMKQGEKPSAFWRTSRH
jgi:hypothetical protein